MGFLSSLFSGGGKAAGEVVKGTLSGVGTLATDIRSAITGDLSHAEKAAIQTKVIDLEQAVQTAQAQIDTAEAQNVSVFVAGWRPALGWLFAIILALHYVVRPIAEWILTMDGHPMILPDVNLTQIWPILIGMLGLGTLRTVEKGNGTQSHH